MQPEEKEQVVSSGYQVHAILTRGRHTLCLPKKMRQTCWHNLWLS